MPGIKYFVGPYRILTTKISENFIRVLSTPTNFQPHEIKIQDQNQKRNFLQSILHSEHLDWYPLVYITPMMSFMVQ
jgi:hypothetical protein